MATTDTTRRNPTEQPTDEFEQSAKRFAETFCLAMVSQSSKPPVSEVPDSEDRRNADNKFGFPNVFIVADKLPVANSVKAESKAKELSADEVQQVQNFLEQLGDKDWHKRERASKSLKQFGAAALPMIHEALRSSNSEVQLRCESLIKSQVNGGLIPIDRLPQAKQFTEDKPPVIAKGQAFGAILRINDEVPSTPQSTGIREAQRFADDQSLKSKRQEVVGQILDQNDKGKIELSAEDVRNLRKEQMNLKNIDRLCAWLEADLALVHAEAGETEKTKEMLLKAAERDPSVKETHMVASAVRKANLSQDEQFKKDFEKIAGASKELWGPRKLTPLEQAALSELPELPIPSIPEF